MSILVPGTRIGPYEIVSRPMMGGMGVVYFCLDHADDGRPVALKTFKPEYLPDRAARDRFLREGTVWVQLGHHPHIVRCYKVAYIAPTTFLVLELIAKEQGRDDASLHSWIGGAPMPLEQALLFALQIARGMKHATEKIPGFVHRDLKPENILVGSDKLPRTNINRLRITDFGLATMLKGEGGSLKDDEGPEALERTRLTHGIVGTPLYMAPEQWGGKPGGVYTDVYALGCILYEMLTGKRVASGQKISELQAAHCTGKLRPIPEYLPRGVHVFLWRSLALLEGERYQIWDEVVDALYDLGAKLPDLAQSNDSLAERGAEILSYMEIGSSYVDIGKAQVAVNYHERALNICREIGYLSGEGYALSRLGHAYYHLGDMRRAVKYGEEALKISHHVGDQHEKASVLNNLGAGYTVLGDTKHAIGYHEQALDVSRNAGYRQGEMSALGGIGNVYSKIGDYQRAIGYYEETLKMTREIGNKHSEAVVLGNLGVAYKNLGDMQQAIKYYKQQLSISLKLGDRLGEGNAQGNLAIVYETLGDEQRAIGYYDDALKIAREIGNRRTECVTLGNLGMVYANLGEMMYSIRFCEQSLKIAQEIGDRDEEGRALNKLGVVYECLGDMPHAIRYYREAIAVWDEIGDLNGVALGLFTMAIIHGEQGQPEQAIPLAEKAERIFAKINSPNLQEVRQLLAQLKKM